MSLAVAVPCAIGAALAYGASNAVQHSAVNTGAGQIDARRLVGLLRNPRWLASVGGDTCGLLLQIIALATGPVVLISPLLVLAVPVSLPVGWLLGGPRPTSADYRSCLAILIGLGVFTALVGDPGIGRALPTGLALVTVLIALGLGATAFLLVRGRSSAVRAGVYGGVSGAGYGLVGVLLNATTSVYDDGGTHELFAPRGLVPLIGVALVGLGSMIVLQIAFQVGSLAASFPANESTAPVVAVLLGVLLLHQKIPNDVVHIVTYLLCFALLVFGTVRLGRAHERRAE
ncbi:hypothetical protein SAMN05444157_0928 [Frankineae bacterium MT45]|nr:hypothetical protein SAMN05444157_0928 [Frankineae bacterium MT45]